jgi:hypothetical protein
MVNPKIIIPRNSYSSRPTSLMPIKAYRAGSCACSSVGVETGIIVGLKIMVFDRHTEGLLFMPLGIESQRLLKSEFIIFA